MTSRHAFRAAPALSSKSTIPEREHYGIPSFRRCRCTIQYEWHPLTFADTTTGDAAPDFLIKFTGIIDFRESDFTF